MNIYQNQKVSRIKAIMAIVLVVVLLSCCVLVGSLVAWLTDEDTISTNPGDIVIGHVDFDIYNGSTKITSYKSTADGLDPDDISTATSNVVELTGSNAIKNVNIKIRNTGTVAAIMRVTLKVYFLNDDDQMQVCLIRTGSTFTDDKQIVIDNSGWVNMFNGDVAVGYTFYNDVIQPYTISHLDSSGNKVSQTVTANEVSLMTSILVPDSMKAKKYYISLTIDGVAHSGNIYQELAAGQGGSIPKEAYPFGVLTSTFLTDWTAWE